MSLRPTRVKKNKLKPGLFLAQQIRFSSLKNRGNNSGWAQDIVALEICKKLTQYDVERIQLEYVEPEVSVLLPEFAGEDGKDMVRDFGLELDFALNIAKRAKEGMFTVTSEAFEYATDFIQRLEKASGTVNNRIVEMVAYKRFKDMINSKAFEAPLKDVMEALNQEYSFVLPLFSTYSPNDYHVNHGIFVAARSILHAQCLGLDEKAQHIIGIGGALHDIGLVHLDREHELSSPEGKQKAEFHPWLGGRILRGKDGKPIKGLEEMAVQIVERHEDRPDMEGPYHLELRGDKKDPVKVHVRYIGSEIDLVQEPLELNERYLAYKRKEDVRRTPPLAEIVHINERLVESIETSTDTISHEVMAIESMLEDRHSANQRFLAALLPNLKIYPARVVLKVHAPGPTLFDGCTAIVTKGNSAEPDKPVILIYKDEKDRLLKPCSNDLNTLMNGARDGYMKRIDLTDKPFRNVKLEVLGVVEREVFEQFPQAYK